MSWGDVAPPGSRYLPPHQTGAVLVLQPIVFPADCGMAGWGAKTAPSAAMPARNSISLQILHDMEYLHA